MRKQKRSLSLGERLAYAFIGFVSAGALCLFFTLVPLRLLLSVCVSLLTAMIFAVWGFFRGDRMVEFLSDQWSRLTGLD